MAQEAAASFFVHSFYDDVRLECKLYFPKSSSEVGEDASATQLPLLKAAIVAHPYATLGGCLDDHVVQTMSSTVLDNGFVVCLFNFRGAGKSGGRTSWTAKPELHDYVTIFSFLIMFISEINGETNSSSVGSVQVVLAGYSYGSMIATNLPSLEGIDRFTSTCSREKMQAISTLSRDISRHVLNHLGLGGLEEREAVHHASYLSPTTYGCAADALDTASRRRSREIHESFDIAKQNLQNVFSKAGKKSHERSKSKEPISTQLSDLVGTTWSRLKLATLVVSPLLPPVLSFLTAFSKLSIESSEMSGDHNQNQSNSLTRQPALVIHGTGDTFTSTQKFRKWCIERSAESSTLETKIVHGAGHFWLDEKYERELDESITKWLQKISLEANPGVRGKDR